MNNRLRPPPLPSNIILNIPSKPILNESKSVPKNEPENDNKENVNSNINKGNNNLKLKKDEKVEILTKANSVNHNSIKENPYAPIILPNPDINIEISQTMKILIVGNAKCGKSSVIARYASDSFQENYKTTIGADFVRKDVGIKLPPDDKITGVRLQLWDIAGQDRFQKLTRVYFAKAKGVVIVCDVSREGTVDAIKNWKTEIDTWAQLSGFDNIPVILFANKADLLSNAQDALKTGAIMERICREHGILNWWSTSARTGESVDEGFTILVSHILENESKISNQEIKQSNNENSDIIKLNDNVQARSSNSRYNNLLSCS